MNTVNIVNMGKSGKPGKCIHKLVNQGTWIKWINTKNMGKSGNRYGNDGKYELINKMDTGRPVN